MAEVSTPFVCLGKILIQVRVNLRGMWGGLLGGFLKDLAAFQHGAVCLLH